MGSDWREGGAIGIVERISRLGYGRIGFDRESPDGLGKRGGLVSRTGGRRLGRLRLSLLVGAGDGRWVGCLRGVAGIERWEGWELWRSGCRMGFFVDGRRIQCLDGRR